MNAVLSSRVAHRILTVADLNIPSLPDGAEPIIADIFVGKDVKQELSNSAAHIANQVKNQLQGLSLHVAQAPIIVELRPASVRIQRERYAESSLSALRLSNECEKEVSGHLNYNVVKPKVQRSAGNGLYSNGKIIEFQVSVQAVDTALTELYDSNGD
jgi:hypothetical protein